MSFSCFVWSLFMGGLCTTGLGVIKSQELNRSVVQRSTEGEKVEKTDSLRTLEKFDVGDEPLSVQEQSSQKRMQEILDDWDVKESAWVEKMNAATTREDRSAIFKKKPKGKKVASELWGVIHANLQKNWTAPAIVWFLNHMDIVGQFPDPKPRQVIDGLLATIEAFHSIKPTMRVLAPSFITLNHPKADVILQKCYRYNADKVSQGVAAIAMEIRLRLGGAADTPESEKLRGGYIRFAVENIDDAHFEMPFGRATVDQVLQEELYRVQHLTLMKPALPIKAQTIAGKEFDTQKFLGKPIVVFFWNPQIAATVNEIGAIERHYQNLVSKGVEMVVISPNSADYLKNIAQKGKLEVPFIADEEGKIYKEYRVNAGYEALIIDRKGLIRLKKAPGVLLDILLEPIITGKNDEESK